MDDLTKFWARVDVHGDEKCWPWLGPIDHSGYGVSTPGNLPGSAHRVVYQELVGELLNDDEGNPLVIDHMCHDPATCDLVSECPHRRCCNPSHLRLTTRAENVAKGRALSRGAHVTHCPKGHEYTNENTYVYQKKNGGSARFCRACGRESGYAYRAKKKARKQMS